tara:strand:+ start:159 stop:371 length:213 start_codon:yes stop_codon:yes gene_type:complete
MSLSSDQLSQWQKALEEKTKQRDTLQNNLNNVTAEILQIRGGLQFAAEMAANETNDVPAEVEVEAEQPDQ